MVGRFLGGGGGVVGAGAEGPVCVAGLCECEGGVGGARARCLHFLEVGMGHGERDRGVGRGVGCGVGRGPEVVVVCGGFYSSWATVEELGQLINRYLPMFEKRSGQEELGRLGRFVQVLLLTESGFAQAAMSMTIRSHDVSCMTCVSCGARSGSRAVPRAACSGMGIGKAPIADPRWRESNITLGTSRYK